MTQMKKNPFNILLCFLSALFFVSSSYGGNDDYKYTLSYSLFIKLLLEKETRNQYLMISTWKYEDKTLWKENDNYEAYCKEMDEVDDRFRPDGIPKIFLSPYPMTEEHFKERARIQKKYDVRYMEQSFLDLTRSVRLKPDHIFEEGKVDIDKVPTLKNKLSALCNTIELSIKEKFPDYVSIKSLIANAEEIKKIEESVSKRDSVISDVLKAIDLTQIGEHDENCDPQIEGTSHNKERYKGFIIVKRKI
jgi:hypothetical protein